MIKSNDFRNPPKLIIFDLDGTLIHFPTEYLLDEALRIIEMVQHPQVSRSDLLVAFSNFDFFRFVSTPDPEQFVEIFWGNFDWSNFPEPQPFAKTLAVMKELHDRGFKLAIATARQNLPEELKTLLEPTGFLPFLSVICTKSCHQGDWKDKSPQIQTICDQLGILPEESMIVGDIPPDITSGQAVGIGYTVAVTSGGILTEVLAATGPDFILEDLTGLLELDILLSELS